MSELITPDQSMKRGALISLAISTAPTALTWYLIQGWPDYLDLAIPLVVMGFVSSAVFKSGNDKGHVPVQSAGVGTWQNGLTDKRYAVGDHWLIPGLQGITAVDQKPKTIHPKPIEQLVRDRVPIIIDAFFIAYVKDPIKNLQGVHDPDKTLGELFETQIRLFVGQWNKAEDLIQQKDMLADFLQLSCKGSAEGIAFKKRLLEFTLAKNGPALDTDSVNNIMEQEGRFCASAALWGYDVTQIHVEDVDLPKTIKDAAAKKAAEPDLMGDLEIKKQALKNMALELKNELEISGEDASNIAAMFFDFKVTKNINEISIRDLDKIAKRFGPDVAKAAANVAKAMTKGDKK